MRLAVKMNICTFFKSKYFLCSSLQLILRYVLVTKCCNLEHQTWGLQMQVRQSANSSLLKRGSNPQQKFWHWVKYNNCSTRTV